MITLTSHPRPQHACIMSLFLLVFTCFPVHRGFGFHTAGKIVCTTPSESTTDTLFEWLPEVGQGPAANTPDPYRSWLNSWRVKKVFFMVRITAPTIWSWRRWSSQRIIREIYNKQITRMNHKKLLVTMCSLVTQTWIKPLTVSPLVGTMYCSLAFTMLYASAREISSCGKWTFISSPSKSAL